MRHHRHVCELPENKVERQQSRMPKPHPPLLPDLEPLIEQGAAIPPAPFEPVPWPRKKKGHAMSCQIISLSPSLSISRNSLPRTLSLCGSSVVKLPRGA